MNNLKENNMKIRILVLGFLMTMSAALQAQTYNEREDVKQFIQKMVNKHRFDEQLLNYWLEDVKQQKTALDAIARPAEGRLTWAKYRKIFLTNKRIKQGVVFWQKNKDLLARAEKEFGVPAQIIVGILGVETFYGRRIGNYPVLDALVSLGFDYPPRGKFFRSELEHFLLMAREEKTDPRLLKGSYAGAMGMPQFISSSFREYAIDFDGDKKRDLWASKADVIGSVANYFKRHGWRAGEVVASRASVPVTVTDMASKKMRPHTKIKTYLAAGVTPLKPLDENAEATLLKLDGNMGMEYWLTLNNFYVITRYNHSPLYAMAVYQLGQAVAAEYYKGF